MANVRDIKMVPPHNRLIGDMPKIGIRPTIDGRLGGVRESLEVQTMAMAQSVANLLVDNLRHASTENQHFTASFLTLQQDEVKRRTLAELGVLSQRPYPPGAARLDGLGKGYEMVVRQ